MKKNRILIILNCLFLFYSCTTTEQIITAEPNNINNQEYIQENIDTFSELAIEQKQDNFVFDLNDEPEILTFKEENVSEILSGTAALKQNLKDITVPPEYDGNHLKAWTYQEGKIYTVHTQTYHSTVIQLEPGEQLLEVPYISEPDVWRISPGVGIKNGLDTQFLIIKPDYSNLVSTLILITNKRVYQMEIRSYKDNYMPYVKWNYPMNSLETNSWNLYKKNIEKNEFGFSKNSSIEFCSFNYNIRKGFFSSYPLWFPETVYDDGKFTYIILNKRVLMQEMPTVFLENRKLVNSEIKNNMIIINQLISKCTLRIGKQSVVITKRKTK